MYPLLSNSPCPSQSTEEKKNKKKEKREKPRNEDVSPSVTQTHTERQTNKPSSAVQLNRGSRSGHVLIFTQNRRTDATPFIL